MNNPDRDALTGAGNVAYFAALLPRVLEHNGEIALLLMAVESLGDQSLKRIAREIAVRSGTDARVFRTGNREFAVILYENSLEKAREVAASLRAGHQSGNPSGPATLSLGLAHFPTHATSAETLRRVAENALFEERSRHMNS